MAAMVLRKCTTYYLTLKTQLLTVQPQVEAVVLATQAARAATVATVCLALVAVVVVALGVIQELVAMVAMGFVTS